MNRRHFILGTGALAALSPLTFAQKNQNAASRKRMLRVAHLTDIHVMPYPIAGRDIKLRYNPAESMAACIRHVQSLEDKPDFIINSGDCVMDSLKKTREEVMSQWAVWQEVLKNELELPIYHAIGNHDVWGWANKDRLENPEYGKSIAIEQLGLSSRFYTFAQNGWNFIVLDSTHFDAKSEGGYIAKLDDEQYAWLESTLKSLDANTPICVVSHIPVISFSPFFDGDNETSGDWKVPGAWMHIDSRKIKDLFKPFSQIKLAISGHIHLQDRVDYLGIKYLCNGAVSGGWWNGNYQEFSPAYVLIDLYSDGSSEHQVVPYLY